MKLKKLCYAVILPLAVVLPCLSQVAFADDQFQSTAVLNQPIVQNSVDDKIQAIIFNLMAKTQEGNQTAFTLLNQYMADKSHDLTLAYYLKGLMLYQGLGTPVNKDEAYTNFLDASDNYSNASYLAGYMLIHGDGVDVDVEYGMELMTQAANQGQMDAVSELAVLNYQQSLVEKNPDLKKIMETSSYRYAQKCAVDKRKNCILVLANIFEGGLANIKKSVETGTKLRALAKNAQ